MKAENDLVDAIVCIARRIGRLDDQTAALLEDEIRFSLGGERGIHKRSPESMQARNAAIVAAVGPKPGEGRMTVSEAARHFSVSRRHIYRLLESATDM